MVMKKTNYIGEKTANLLYYMLKHQESLGLSFRIETTHFGGNSLTPEFYNVESDSKREQACTFLDTINAHILEDYADYYYAAIAFSVIKHIHGNEANDVAGLAISAKGKFINLYLEVPEHRTLRVDMCDKRVKAAIKDIMNNN